MNAWPHNKIYNNVHWEILRHSMEPAGWLFTRITNHHESVVRHIDASAGELAVVTAKTAESNWYALTTRRMIGVLDGVNFDIAADKITRCDFGQNAKGHGGVQLATANVTLSGGKSMNFEFETGRAWMAPECYTSWWVRKYAIFDSLKFDPNPKTIA